MTHPSTVADTLDAGDGWIEWAGGECPVAYGSDVDVVFDDGVAVDAIDAGFWAGDGTPEDPNWWLSGNAHGHNIVRYRLTVQP